MRSPIVRSRGQVSWRRTAVGAIGAGALAIAAAWAAPAAYAQEAAAPPDAARAQGELRQLARRVGPSVVGVKASRARRAGTGFLIDTDGLLLTSSAVVPAGSTKIQVTLSGGRKVFAVEVTRDPGASAVALRIEGASALALKPLVLEVSRAVRPGQMVATFSNAFGTITRDGTPAMSVGVVSGSYPMPGASRGAIAIETDAAVNPGSFGGPLVDLDGRVVGMVVPAYRNDRWLGLARPIGDLSDLVEAARAGRALVVAQAPADEDGERGLLGIFIYKDDDQPGAEIVRVQKGSPAAQAGIRAGDLVRRVSGHKIRSSKQLAGFLLKVRAGQKVTLRVERAGWFRDFRLLAVGNGRPFLGVFLEAEGGHLVVKKTVAGGPAAKAGLKPGDVLVDFADLGALRRFMKGKRPNQTIKVLVERDGWQKRAKITLGSRPASASATPARGPKRQARTPKTTPRTPETPRRPTTKKRGFLGVYMANAEYGVKVRSVVPGSPAEKAGLKANDVIVEARGQATPTIDAFTAVLKGARVGDKVKLAVARNGQAQKLTVTLGERPAHTPSAPRAHAPKPTPKKQAEKPAPKKPGFLGISVQEEGPEGQLSVVITEVTEGSPAAKAGLKPGQRLLTVNGRAIRSIDDVRAQIGGHFAGETIDITVGEAGDAGKLKVSVQLAARK